MRTGSMVAVQKRTAHAGKRAPRVPGPPFSLPGNEEIVSGGEVCISIRGGTGESRIGADLNGWSCRPARSECAGFCWHLLAAARRGVEGREACDTLQSQEDARRLLFSCTQRAPQSTPDNFHSRLTNRTVRTKVSPVTHTPQTPCGGCRVTAPTGLRECAVIRSV